MAAAVEEAGAAGAPKSPAEEFKEKGNDLFKKNKYEEAILWYSKAVAADPANPVYLANRAQCHIKLENYGTALIDASHAIKVDPSYTKAYYRRGTAYFALNKYQDALDDFKQVAKMKPADKDAQRKLKECREAVRLAALSEAIGGYSKLPSESVDLSTIQVEASYTGPRLPEPITLDFVKELMETFRQGGRLHRKYAIQIILGVIKLLAQLPTLVDIDVPPGTRLTVCGDVHGQFYDMLNIFKINGLPGPENPYLFNGDFVDRGSWSVEVILTFFSFKLLYPNHFHLTRGNHESRTLNQIYGFQGEVTAKLDQFCFELFNEAFCLLPLAYCIGKKVLVVHGGLFSEDGVTLDQIRAIDRNCQPPDKGLMCELLWSDPQEEPGRAPSKRGVGYSFGPDVTKRFLDDNKLDLLVRSHEVKAEGYEFAAGSRLVTVFSAPNYCDQMGNKGAFLVFDSTLKPKVTSFAAVEHPPVRPMQYANPLFAMQ